MEEYDENLISHFEIWGDIAKTVGDDPTLYEGHSNIDLGRLINDQHFNWTSKTKNRVFSDQDLSDAINKLDVLLILIQLSENGKIIRLGPDTFGLVQDATTDEPEAENGII